MLTPRGWWFFVLVLTVGAIGGALLVRENKPALWLSSLVIALWFGLEWVRFYRQVRLVSRKLELERSVLHDGQIARTLWNGNQYEVFVSVKLPSGSLAHTFCLERPPIGATANGQLSWEGPIEAGQPAAWQYEMKPDYPGVVRFEGVTVRLSDLQGFFYHEIFVRSPQELLVLPRAALKGRPHRGDKRTNLLPPPGVHRFRRPGTGSELLELRDYRPGDPPRRIAWKLSSRRNQLITREYESEVPLRCTLLIDASNVNRIGPPGKSVLATFANVAAAATGTALANRDLMGLIVTDEETTRYIPPARIATQLLRISQVLAETAARQPVVSTSETAPLLRTALAVAREFYPELMKPNLNRFPWWLAWLNPQPAYVRRAGQSPKASFTLKIARVFSDRHRERMAQRKRLAALLTSHYRLPAGAIALLCEDDPTFSRWLQHFLAEHRVPADMPTVDIDGINRFVRPEPLTRQASALLRALGRGRDNELYVLMGEYLERDDHLAPLLLAVRTARAKHHQVLVLQAGPAPTEPQPLQANAGVTEILAFAENSRRYASWKSIRRRFGRLGVPALIVSEADSPTLILHRLEQLRLAEGARRT